VTLLAPATFGAGGAEPYARALRDGDSSTLYLQKVGADGSATLAAMDFARWSAAADSVDFTLLSAVTGPLLDIGCGPGRMVRAAMDLGMVALGIDISPAAVKYASENGLNVIEGSIFDALPREGHWQTALLVDGNIGIGGDPGALLERCRRLLAPAGEVVVEVHEDPDRDQTYTGTLVDAHGRASATFPWAEIGIARLSTLASQHGVTLTESWQLDGRTFCRLSR